MPAPRRPRPPKASNVRENARRPREVRSIEGGVESAGGGRQLKLHATRIFTEEQHARPGPWLPFESSRVTQARYDSGLQQVQVEFKDGTPWVYESVPPNVWRNFRRSPSAGRYINRVLNGYPYRPGPDVWPSGSSDDDE